MKNNARAQSLEQLSLSYSISNLFDQFQMDPHIFPEETESKTFKTFDLALIWISETLK